MYKDIQNQINISATLAQFPVPPLKDMLVLGKQSPIGCIAMRRAIELLIKAPFEHIEFDDDVISDILVRQSLLLRISQDTLIDFVITQVKPLMNEDEIFHGEVEISFQINTSPCSH